MDVDLKHGPPQICKWFTQLDHAHHWNHNSHRSIRRSLIKPSSLPNKAFSFWTAGLPTEWHRWGREGAGAWILYVSNLVACYLFWGALLGEKSRQTKQQCQINPQKHPGIQLTLTNPHCKRWGGSKRKTNGFLAWMGIPTYHIVYHDPHCYQCEAWPIVPALLHMSLGKHKEIKAPNESSERRASRRKSLSCSRFCSNEACKAIESHVTFETLECEERVFADWQS